AITLRHDATTHSFSRFESSDTCPTSTWALCQAYLQSTWSQEDLVYKVLHLFPSASNHVYSNQGRRRSLTVDDIAFITAILRHRPTIYLDKLRYKLHSRRGVFVSLQTLLRTFQQLHINRKCISAYDAITVTVSP
ncbi:hypothetical protein M405DRAFT_759927, partial [Rhizopogon salebrosus TDB-379]